MNTEYQTDRLILKILNPSHLRKVLEFQIRNQELFEKYEPTRPENFYTLPYQHSLLRLELKMALELSTVRFYVFTRNDPHTIIGTVCLHDIVRGPYSCCEIGYKFDIAWQRQGYAREAVAEAVRIAFYELNVHRIFARVMPENIPSIRLLQALSFEQEGLEREAILIRGKWEDHLRFGLLRPTI